MLIPLRLWQGCTPLTKPLCLFFKGRKLLFAINESTKDLISVTIIDIVMDKIIEDAPLLLEPGLQIWDLTESSVVIFLLCNESSRTVAVMDIDRMEVDKPIKASIGLGYHD